MKEERITAIQLKKLEMRHSGLIQLVIAGLVLTFCFAVYHVYSGMRIKTKIATVEASLIEKINLAYSGDQPTHEEIIRRIPVLTDSLLAVSAKQIESDSASLDMEPADELTLEKEVKAVVPVVIYASQQLGAPKLGSLVDDSEIIDIQYGEDWSSITLKNGFPVWIHADFVSKVGPNTVQVVGARVNLRLNANLLPASVVGKVYKGDSLRALIQTSSWYKVNSPSDLQGWVNTQSLENLLQ